MKKIASLFITLLCCVTMLALPAFAASVKEVELYTEPQTKTYQVGDPYQANEISFLVTYADGTAKEVSHEKLTFTANGTSVKQGYKFKEPGTKKVVVTYGDYEYKYTLKVTAKNGKTLNSISLAQTPKTTTYKVGQGFKGEEVNLLCVYTDGTNEKISSKTARIYANGNPIQDGYQFTQAGPKSVNVEYGGKSTSYKLWVVPNTTKKVKDCELISQPQTLRYKVGQGFRADELTVRCTYTDGTYEDFDHHSIEVYASGGTVQLINGYKFKEAGTKAITVEFLDYQTDFTIKVV